MESKVIQEFIGEINGFKINDKNIYNAVEYLGEAIENKFGKVFNKEFIPALASTIERMEDKYSEFSFRELENSFSNSIEKAKKFKEIKFEYYGSDWKIETLNKELSEGKYLDKKGHIPKKTKAKEENER
ncbi:hypothetical protein [Fusobacterium gastrosuis]|uniref:hypothetical protein n=1 Tax=Fusobacterium gastrosuis TaxID=1755100 RepID=UPI0029779B6B|nr:hypothetical protein [Fusobacteriaceae bacterium]MDY5714091.1 hypothetical protein [Fusobacterium gastrosuis]